ncbi:hypothetical protein SISNIDRAFT_414012, partial [Sistotremastrum niveocremeum HHB9708]
MVVTTPTKRARITELKDLGLSDREVGRRIGVDHKTVGRVYREHRVKHDFYNIPRRCGRPHRLSKADARQATMYLARGHAQDAADVCRQLFPTVSASTVRRALKDEGIHSAVRCKKPALTKKH